MSRSEQKNKLLAEFVGYQVKKPSEMGQQIRKNDPDPLSVWDKDGGWVMILSNYDPENNYRDLFQVVDVLEMEYLLTTRLESLNTDPKDIKYHFVIEYTHKISKVKVESDFLDTYPSRQQAVYNSCLNVVEKIISLNK